MSREYASALDQAAHWPVHFNKGQTIYDEGELSEAMYRVQTGCVRLQVNGANGSRQIVRFVFPGEVFGLCMERRNTAAEAVTNVELIRFSLSSVLELCAVNAAAAIELMDLSTLAYRELAHHIERIAHLPATERVAWFFNLMQKHAPIDADCTPPRMLMSHRDIADFLAITPETLSRSLKILQQRNSRTRQRPRPMPADQPGFAA